MWVSNVTEDNLTNEIVDKMLFEGLKDEGQKVDCIIVLGSLKAAQYRVPVAADAFRSGRSEKIMLCGGALRDALGESMSEAELMRQRALELGIPSASIIMENASQNTIENILFSMIELQRSFWLNNVKGVLLVTTSYHMRRSLQIARYLYPTHIQVYPCPADDTNTRRDNWMKSEAGMKRARAEVLNIVRCVKNGVIPDFEV